MSTKTHQAPSTTQQSFVSRQPLGLVTAGALVVAAVVAETYGLLARAVGVDFVAGSFGSDPAEIPVMAILITVLIEGAPGIVLALALARWARRPRSTWKRITWTLTALSIVPVIFADAAFSTQVALTGAHLMAAGIVITTVATRLADTNPRRS